MTRMQMKGEMPCSHRLHRKFHTCRLHQALAYTHGDNDAHGIFLFSFYVT